MDALNLGCGDRFHPSWTNLDVEPADASVRAHDVTTGLPFPDAGFDVVYHSHLLEHMARDRAPALLAECRRVLRPGGTIRVVVPDLEAIIELYRDCLARARAGAPGADADYDWMLIELFDQTVRETTGGRLGLTVCDPDLANRDFVMNRAGPATARAVERFWSTPAAPAGRRPSRRARLVGLAREPRRIREMLARRLLGEDHELLELGRFRRSGEIHQWMYDRYALGRLLREAGFGAVRAVGAGESRVADWTTFELDTDADGAVVKPDSMFVEASVPPVPSTVPGESVTPDTEAS